MKKIISLISLISLMSLLAACGGGGGGGDNGSGPVSSTQKEFSLRASKTTLIVSEASGDSAEIIIDGSDVTLTAQADDPVVIATMNGRTLSINPVSESSKQAFNVTVTGSGGGVSKKVVFVVNVVNLAANDLIKKSTWIDSSKDSLIGFQKEEELVGALTSLAFKAGLLAKKEKDALLINFSMTAENEKSTMAQAISVIKNASDNYKNDLIGASELKTIYTEETAKLDASISKVFNALNQTVAVNQIVPQIKPVKIVDMDSAYTYSQFEGNKNLGSYSQGAWIYGEQYKALNALFSTVSCEIN